MSAKNEMSDLIKLRASSMMEPVVAEQNYKSENIQIKEELKNDEIVLKNVFGVGNDVEVQDEKPQE